jgi:hypothetical protein
MVESNEDRGPIMAGGFLHKCSADEQMRRWLPLYVRVRLPSPSSMEMGVRAHVRRSFVRVGFLCSACGTEITDAQTVSRAQALRPAPRKRL